jgi:cytochrome b6-f complex iron-sulfur subunit
MAERANLVRERKTGSTRRELLNYAWLASLGILTVQVAGISLYFSLPRFREGEFGGFITIGPVAELPTAGSSPINRPEGKFWLVRTEEGLTALYKVCTHLDCLSTWDEQEEKFICPCHGSQFARDGTYLSGPAPRSLDRFLVQVISPHGSLVAETDPQTGAPLPIREAAEEPSSQASNSAVPANLQDQTYGESILVAPDAIVRVDTGHRILGDPATT